MMTQHLFCVSSVSNHDLNDPKLKEGLKLCIVDCALRASVKINEFNKLASYAREWSDIYLCLPWIEVEYDHKIKNSQNH